jgi:hypothetical protein
MDDRLARLESTLDLAWSRIATLEARLAALEANARAQTDLPVDDLGVPALDDVPVQQWLGLAGRTLVVLGGAYLLRALTGAHVLSAQVGVAFGLLYGAPWLWLGSRAGAKGAHLDALCHALATALIGYPLVWEATTRFNALTTIQSAVLLGVLTGAALLLASTRRLHSLAWVVTFGAQASACGLAIVTGDWVPYSVLAIGVGVATLWLGYTREWMELRWPAAGVANFMVAIATGRAVVSGAPHAMLLVHLLMLTAYLGSFAIRTLVIGRRVIPFEAAQSAGVLAVAFGGAIILIRSTGSNALAVGMASLALAAAGYFVAFGFAEKHRHFTNFFFYSLVALVFAIVGTAVCFGPAVASVLYAAIGCGAAWLARRNGRLTLALHAAIYVIAAAVASGLLPAVSAALSAPWTGAHAMTIAAWIALAALACVVVLPVTRPIESWGLVTPAPRLVMVALLTWCAMGAASLIVATGLSWLHAVDPAVMATIRTAVFVLATLAVARAARLESGREAGWLTYPLLVIAGLKLLLVDFPLGRPETLFVSLALYGCALIAAPRLYRLGRPPEAASSPAAAYN